MSLLTRYLIRNNIFLLFCILLIGTGLYVLTDLFERLDHFMDSGIGLSGVLWYYVVKLPVIIGQIMPAVFLLSVIMQFALMAKSRELTALQSGGISPVSFLRFILVYGMIWSAVQLGLTQVLGVEGDRMAARIWSEQIRGRVTEKASLKGLWFLDGQYVVHLGLARPEDGSGKDFLAYELMDDGNTLKRLVRAKTFKVEGRTWTLFDVGITVVDGFGSEQIPEYTIPLKQDLEIFLAIDPTTKPSQLPLWNLAEAIASLKESGSNVEILQTTYYSRFAYAASLVVMGIMGLAIVLWRSNVYIAVATGLLVTFIFYASTTLCTSLGENGSLAPILAAWLSLALFGTTGLLGVLASIRPRLFGR